jgi:diguanylate cyclase (GGDEF)-like protein
LAALAPLLVFAFSTALSQRKAGGIATVLALRTVVLLSLGFAVLATVATVSVLQAGLRELRARNAPQVRTLAIDLEQMPMGLFGPNAPLGLTLFRAKYPTVRFVAVGPDHCQSECLVDSDDKQTGGDKKILSDLSRVWPSSSNDQAMLTVGGKTVLLLAEPMRDPISAKSAVVVVGIDAAYLDIQASRTAWIILAIAYSLLVIVGWSSWRQLNSSLGSRIEAITRQIRAGSVSEEPSESLSFDGTELSELAEAAQAYIQATLEEQKSSDERYRRLVELAPDGVLMCSTSGIKFANSAALALAGVRNRYDVIGSPIEKFLEFEPQRAGDSSPGMLRPAKWKRVDGTLLHVEVAEITASGRGADGRQFMVRDVTDRRVREAALAHRAEHDSLTGLVNRARFESRLVDLLDAHERAPKSPTPQYVAVLFIDLDGFKPVNDRYGHAAGDAVLVGVAARLRESTRGTDVIARLGGDEFAVLIEVREPEEVNAVAERILHALKRPILFDGYELSVGASIGIADSRLPNAGADSPDPGDRSITAAELLRAADAAMYAAKAEGGRRYGGTPLSTPAVQPKSIDADPAAALRVVA